LSGFIWTKIEKDDGEIYAVGVDPGHQGRGLGTALTAAGLTHIASRARRATLYVDGDNAAALATYARAGFEQAGIDVQFAHGRITAFHTAPTGAIIGA
jgi:mycothiol synthase